MKLTIYRPLRRKGKEEEYIYIYIYIRAVYQYIYIYTGTCSFECHFPLPQLSVGGEVHLICVYMCLYILQEENLKKKKNVCLWINPQPKNHVPLGSGYRSHTLIIFKCFRRSHNRSQMYGYWSIQPHASKAFFF
jgi:hypothetical protein